MKNRMPLKIDVWMNSAKEISKLSTCQFTQVGCVLLSKDMRVISTGYNGTATNCQHCSDFQMTREEHKEFSDSYEIHAEMNALIQSLGRTSSLQDAICVSTLQPCLNCVKHLYQAGVRVFIFGEKYWRIDQELYERQILNYFIGSVSYQIDDYKYILSNNDIGIEDNYDTEKPSQ